MNGAKPQEYLPLRKPQAVSSPLIWCSHFYCGTKGRHLERYVELSAADPVNPFYTFAHARAEEDAGGEPWLLGCRDQDRLVCGCIGVLRRGRLNCRLTIASLPDLPEEFWAGLKSLIAAEGITMLELNTFSSRTSNIPSFGTELKRKRRYEYVVPLEGNQDDVLGRMNKHHRQSVRKGISTGLVVRTGSECPPEDHVKVIGASMERRVGRGEQIESHPTLDGLQACLNSGLCRLFQACRGDDVLSSMSVAVAPRGRYLHTSGTNPEGMKTGASHYLLYEIMRVSMAEGATQSTWAAFPILTRDWHSTKDISALSVGNRKQLSSMSVMDCTA